MRNATVLRSLLAATLFAAAASAHAASVEVVLSGARKQTGQFQVALVDAGGFAGTAKAIAGRQIVPAGDATRLVFDDVAPGRYAVMVSHDENGNGKLDANLLGMPIEGYGFSNNPRVMRKPTFEEAAFEVADQPVSIDIAIR